MRRRPHGNRPPRLGLVDVNSAFPGLRAGLRRFTSGYGSIGASGAKMNKLQVRAKPGRSSLPLWVQAKPGRKDYAFWVARAAPKKY